MNNLITQSKFFNVPATISKEKLKRYCEIWYFLQAEFTLGTSMLNGKLAEELLKAVLRHNKEEELLLEYLFKTQALAAIDEIGIGRKKTLMHHKLFDKQVIDSGITIESLDSDIHQFPKEVSLLRDAVHKSFDLKQPNSLSGLCMSHVVETIAPELFTAQYHIFLNAGVPSKHLKHSIVHMELEQNHASEAESMYQKIQQLYSVKSVVDHVEKYSLLWKNFLNMVADEVY